MPSRDEVVAGYTAVEIIGRGGCAIVYRAHDRDGAAVALKVLDDQHLQPDQLTRLQREFEFAGRLPHPHIVSVLAAGPTWLTMELLDGGPVSNLSGTAARLAALTQIARALDHAHRHGIVHCDVKPANILVDRPFSRAVLVDFGVAHSVAEDVAARLAHDPAARLSLDPAKRITHQVRMSRPRLQASLPYSAPELLSGRAPTAATDQYALACTAVELLTGAPPYPADDAQTLVDQHLYAAPPRISERTELPRVLDTVVTTALSKDPECRYASCAEFIALVTTSLDAEGDPAPS